MVIAIIVSPLLGHHLTQTQIGGFGEAFKIKCQKMEKVHKGGGVSAENQKVFFIRGGRVDFQVFPKY